jgi:long-chain fatty acid transport protein
MKKIFALIGLFCVSCLWVSPLFAGGVLNKQNQSTEYVRTLNRNAATDAADIVAFNPAGVTKLADGFYVKADVMYFDKKYSNNVENVFPFPGEDGEYESTAPSIIPGFFSIYKQDRWAGFFSVTVPGGGGKVDYSDGNARTAVLAAGIIAAGGGAYTGIRDMSLEADSLQLGYTLGGAFKINDMISLSAGLRYIDAKQEFKGHVDLISALPIPTRYEVDLQRKAHGWGYFAGVNVTPIENLNFGITYFSRTELDFESSVDKDDAGITPLIGWEDGTTQREDLPGVIGAGVSYNITPQLRVEVNYTQFLETQAALDEERFKGIANSWDAGIAMEYAFTPQWKASIGYLHTEINGMPEENKLTESPELDANTVSAGLVFAPIDRFKISLGALRAFYASETTNSTSSRSPEDTELSKDVWAIALGLEYRFF